MVPLSLLRPRWLALEGREHMGLELDCPRHPDGERVQVWFENPCDGGPPIEVQGSRLWLASGCDEEGSLHEVTLLPGGGASYRPVQLGHWWGWLIEGQLSECRVTGVAW